MRYDKELQKRQERAKKHNCDGRCYWSGGMCGAADWCEETGEAEFIGTVGALLTIVDIPIIVIVGAIIWIANIL